MLGEKNNPRKPVPPASADETALKRLTQKNRKLLKQVSELQHGRKTKECEVVKYSQNAPIFIQIASDSTDSAVRPWIQQAEAG